MQAPKFWAFPESLFALRVGASSSTRADKDKGADKVVALQTSPPAGIPGVAGLRYSGAYPVTRLVVEDATLPVKASLFGYSRCVQERSRGTKYKHPMHPKRPMPAHTTRSHVGHPTIGGMHRSVANDMEGTAGALLTAC